MSSIGHVIVIQHYYYDFYYHYFQKMFRFEKNRMLTVEQATDAFYSKKAFGKLKIPSYPYFLHFNVQVQIII